MKKLVLTTLIGVISLPALAADWRTFPAVNPEPKVQYDWDSLQQKQHQLSYDEEIQYFDVKIRKTFKTPQTLKSGKFFTIETYTLSLDCANKEYAITDYEWFINGQKVAENKSIPWSAAWQDFKAVPRVNQRPVIELKGYRVNDIQASSLCSQLVG